MSIEKDSDRREWRQFLISAAITNELLEQEERGADRTVEERDAAVYATSCLILSTTLLDGEDTSDTLALISGLIFDGVRERERMEREEMRERWVRAVATGATNKGFDDWLADRD